MPKIKTKEVTPMPYTPNPEIEKLKVEREHNEAKLRYHKNQLKALKHEESELNRKARNHRVFTRGGMLESFLLRPLLLTDDQVHSILKIAFHPKEVGDLIKRFIDENERKLAEEEQDEKAREN